MATIILNPLIKDLRKRLDTNVFSKWKKTNYVKMYSVHKDKSSEKQQKVRMAFSLLVSVWKQVNGVHHRGWEVYSANSNMTAYNAFIGKNAGRQKNGESLNLFMPLGEEPLAGFSAETGASAGTISCAFAPSSASAGKHVAFFAQKRENGIAEGKMLRFDAGADPVSPFPISGLEAGKGYFVYAVVTDKAYCEALSASASLDSTAVAGA